MKYYIIAGEASGDLHGSNLMKEIFRLDDSAVIRFWGGDLMAAVGGTLVKHYKELAFMGFLEVVANLRTILNNISVCKKDIEEFKPDVLVFIDYPGFNMRIAKWAKEKSIPTHYYISPQIWAWKENRIKAIKRDVDQMYVILPFEKDFYEKKHHYPVSFVGHPLIDAIHNFRQNPNVDFRKENNLTGAPIIAVLPGSRKQEITKMLNLMLSVVKDFPDYQFVIAGAPGQDKEFYDQFAKGENVSFVSNQTYDLLNNAHAAMVTSGTATLETALFKVPEIVCYRSSVVSYEIAKRVVDLEFISLVNLIMGKEIVKELIQKELSYKRLKHELKAIVEGERRSQMIADYSKLEKLLGGTGASENVAQLLVKSVKK